MSERPTILLFDIDGTLVTCGGAGRRAIEAAFLELCGRSDVCNFAFGGSTDRAIARQGLINAGRIPDGASIDAVLTTYLRHLGPNLAQASGYRVMPGVVALLDALEGVPNLAIGLGTGNVEAGARAKLRPAGLDRRFAFGGFGCDAEERAQLLEAGAERGAARLGAPRDRCRVVVIGDTPRDVSAALAVGVECVGVSTGSYDRAALASAGAHAAFDDLTAPELPALLSGREPLRGG